MASFGPIIDLPKSVTLKLIQAENSKLSHGCDIEDFKLSFGKLVMVKRGNCTFVEKSILAEQAGAIGLIVGNTQDKAFLMTNSHDDEGDYIRIPIMMMARSAALRFVKVIVKEKNVLVNPLGVYDRPNQVISIYGKEVVNLKIVESEKDVSLSSRTFWRGLSVIDIGVGIRCQSQCVLRRDISCA